MSDDVSFLSQLVRDSMELQAQEALSKTDSREFNIMKPLQVPIHEVKFNNSVPLNTEEISLLQFPELICTEFTSLCSHL